MGFQKPNLKSENVSIMINSNSDRLQVLKPFLKWDGNNILNLKLLTIQTTIFFIGISLRHSQFL